MSQEINENRDKIKNLKETTSVLTKDIKILSNSISKLWKDKVDTDQRNEERIQLLENRLRDLELKNPDQPRFPNSKKNYFTKLNLNLPPSAKSKVPQNSTDPSPLWWPMSTLLKLNSPPMTINFS